jgi:hypothetical protein
VSTVVCVVLEVPGPKAAIVTPCSFMQFLYEASAVLFAPFAPRAPLGWRLAHAWMAFWNFELPPKPPAPEGGVPPAPDGGVPPAAPEGGPSPLNPLGRVAPCLARHDWNAVVELAPFDEPAEVVAEAPLLLLPHAAIRMPRAANPRARASRAGATNMCL